MKPNTRFTWSDGLAIAYQVVGDGVHDLVYLPGFVANVDISWDVPPIASFLERLASFGRLILLDRRGVGCSDRYPPNVSPPLEECVDDVLAVMDAVGSRSATLIGVQDAAFIAMGLAATHPKRARSLVLFGAAAAWTRNDDMPWETSVEEWAEVIEEEYEPESAFEMAEGYAVRDLPSLAHDPTFVPRFASLMLANQAPGASASELERWARVDMRDALPTIGVPTLILHRVHDPVEPIESGRHLARTIPGARLVELDGNDAMPWAGDVDAVLTEIEAFVAGTPERSTADRPHGDRMLATILFTDIVGSTERAAQLGDAAWREIVVEHEARTRDALTRHAGVFDHTTGDGVMARFDGPARAVRCAQDIGASVHDLGITIRAGVHTGEIELMDSGAHGLAVHLAARVAGLASPDEVWISSTVKDLTAGSGLTFEDAGEHQLKGVPDTWRLYRVVG